MEINESKRGEIKLSEKDLDLFIGSLCNQRLENPDVLLMDRIQGNRKRYDNPFEEEQIGNKIDSTEIEDGIIEDILKNTSTMTLEEIMEFKSSKRYEEYMLRHSQKNNRQEDNVMTSIEEEIKRSLEENPLPSEEETTTMTDKIMNEEETTFRESVEIVSDMDTDKTTTNDNETSSLSDEEVEDISDVPVADLEVADEDVIKKLNESCGNNVSDDDALQMLSVMERYKNGEKFNVYQALPAVFRVEIDKAAMEANVYDLRMRNYFAKNFINDIVQDAYMTTEISNFEEELRGVTEQISNVPGMIIDSYSDEVRNKFEIQMIEIADKIRDESPEKAEQLERISEYFKATYELTKIMDTLNNNPSIINRSYKQGRDDYNHMKRNFEEKFKSISPKIKPIEIVNKCLRTFGYSDEQSKTVTAIVYNSIMSETASGSIEGHIYAYYIMSAFSNMIMSANNSTLLTTFQSRIVDLVSMIDNYMSDFRSSKKNKKSKKK